MAATGIPRWIKFAYFEKFDAAIHERGNLVGNDRNEEIRRKRENAKRIVKKVKILAYCRNRGFLKKKLLGYSRSSPFYRKKAIQPSNFFHAYPTIQLGSSSYV